MHVKNADVNLAYVGLGANLGDPISQLVSARRALSDLPIVVSARSSAIYVSTPVGYTSQPDFFNCVLELAVAGSHRTLFNEMQRVESEMGRVRDSANQNAARTIDLDLLMFENLRVSETDLVLPHPRLHERLFVLRPLSELNEDLAQRYLNDRNTDFTGQNLYALTL